MNDRDRDHQSMQEMRRALDHADAPPKAPVRESESGSDEDPREDAAGSILSSVFQAVKHYDYTWAPDGIDSRIDEDGNLHITLTFNVGTWEASGRAW